MFYQIFTYSNFFKEINISYNTFWCVVSLSIFPSLQTTIENTQRYYTLKCLISYLLSNGLSVQFSKGRKRKADSGA